MSTAAKRPAPSVTANAWPTAPMERAPLGAVVEGAAGLLLSAPELLGTGRVGGAVALDSGDDAESDGGALEPGAEVALKERDVTLKEKDGSGLVVMMESGNEMDLGTYRLGGPGVGIIVGKDSICGRAKADGASVKAAKARAVENFMMRAVVKRSGFSSQH
ncbi:hypothetical protein B0H14DRAFT_2826022 [Mycena olivaceomarginata]|nr:hypothetical protein B0H14DRAFT_2826022 [Mycena olivaceomarginata]